MAERKRPNAQSETDDKRQQAQNDSAQDDDSSREQAGDGPAAGAGQPQAQQPQFYGYPVYVMTNSFGTQPRPPIRFQGVAYYPTAQGWVPIALDVIK